MSRLGVPRKEAGPPAAFWAWCLTENGGEWDRCQLQREMPAASSLPLQ